MYVFLFSSSDILRKRLEPHGIATYTSKPAQNPESLSMINEEEHHHTPFAPTPPATTAHDDPKARAINFTHMDEDPIPNELTKNISKKETKKKVLDLSDVSMDDDEEDIDMEDEMLNARILTPNGAASSSSNGR